VNYYKIQQMNIYKFFLKLINTIYYYLMFISTLFQFFKLPFYFFFSFVFSHNLYYKQDNKIKANTGNLIIIN
jgi:hypothetical protein